MTTDAMVILEISAMDQVGGRTYTRTIHFFPFANEALRTQAEQQLKTGFLLLLYHWPFLCGTIALSPQTRQSNGSAVSKNHVKQSGLVAVHFSSKRPSMKDVDRLLCINTLTKDQFPYTYAELDTAGMPSFPLEDRLFFDTPSHSLEEQATPIIKTKVTFFDGGLAVAMGTNHAVFDGHSRSRMIDQWADFCRSLVQHNLMQDMPSESSVSPQVVYSMSNGEKNSTENGTSLPKPISAETCSLLPEVNEAETNLAAPWTTNIVADPSDVDGLLRDCPEYSILDQSKAPHYHSDNTTARFFVFSGAYVQDLKQRINAQLQADSTLPDSEKPTLSRFVCLTALIWHHLTLARLPHLDLEEESTLATLVGLRPRGLAPPDYFPGNAALHTMTSTSVAEVSSTTPDTLTKLALSVKRAINLVDGAFVARRAKLMASIPDVRRLCNIGESETLRRRAGLIVSSWTDFGMDTEWGIVGAGSSKPAWCRKPWSPAVGYAIVMPRRRGVEADWEVYLGYEERDGERLIEGLGRVTKRIVE